MAPTVAGKFTSLAALLAQALAATAVDGAQASTPRLMAPIVDGKLSSLASPLMAQALVATTVMALLPPLAVLLMAPAVTAHCPHPLHRS